MCMTCNDGPKTKTWDADEAARLYLEGWSGNRLAVKFGVTAPQMYNELRKRVKLRHFGRPRKCADCMRGDRCKCGDQQKTPPTKTPQVEPGVHYEVVVGTSMDYDRPILQTICEQLKAALKKGNLKLAGELVERMERMLEE